MSLPAERHAEEPDDILSLVRAAAFQQRTTTSSIQKRGENCWENCGFFFARKDLLLSLNNNDDDDVIKKIYEKKNVSLIIAGV